MENRIAKFEKVSFEQFKVSLKKYNVGHDLTDDKLQMIYDTIKLPTRSTKDAAGFDFYSYCWFKIEPGQTIIIPTGIKAKMERGWFLSIVPRSSYGFKFRAQLDNTIGIIDGDFYNNIDNEGNIVVKMTNDSNDKTKVLTVLPGDKYVQGIFVPYGITYDDNAEDERIGGIGSTDGKIQNSTTTEA